MILYCHPGPRSGITSLDPPVAFGGQYHFVAPVRLRRASSALRVVRDEKEREFASLTRNLSSVSSSLLISCSSGLYQGRVHALGRRTLDVFSGFSDQERGREASERRTALLLSKEGSTILDEARRTDFLLFRPYDISQTRQRPL